MPGLLDCWLVTTTSGRPSLPTDPEWPFLIPCAARLPSVGHYSLEAKRIVSLAGKENSLSALDFDASRRTATSAELERYRIVHFASHALINSQHPELSGVVLSLVNRNGEPQDGFLRANEIYNLRLNAELVVLSACQTALGKEVKGEGLIGLTRAFMYAGAPRVVALLQRHA